MLKWDRWRDANCFVSNRTWEKTSLFDLLHKHLLQKTMHPHHPHELPSPALSQICLWHSKTAANEDGLQQRPSPPASEWNESQSNLIPSTESSVSNKNPLCLHQLSIPNHKSTFLLPDLDGYVIVTRKGRARNSSILGCQWNARP